MNCFVIMPYDREFNDVYAMIKSGVEQITRDQAVRCFRLDEARPAGRITDRLLRELESSSFCIADITGTKPNVMWEVGYAMALKKPMVLITQGASPLPFDLHDMETLRYDRSFLSESLGAPIKRVIMDTIATLRSLDGRETQGSGHTPSGNDRSIEHPFVGELLEEIRELRSIVGEAVALWNPKVSEKTSRFSKEGLAALEGNWLSDSGSHHYARIVGEDLIVPYCYMGDSQLTSCYYAWRRVGEYWFARFKWLNCDISGFTFLKQVSIDCLDGSWWTDDQESEVASHAPDLASGVSIRWVRQRTMNTPQWATKFVEDVANEGIEKRLQR